MLLKKIISESPYNFCSHTIISNHDSDGFWKMEIDLKDKNNAHTAAFISILRDIGLIYGEGLSIEENGNSIKIA